MQTYLTNSIKIANYYKQLGERTFEQLEEDQLFWSPGRTSNGIAVIVKHLWGNMLSRWTNFMTEDGEKPWRDRESEFEPDILTKSEMMSKWKEGWKCFISALESINPEDLETIIYIRNEGHTIMDAIQRQLAHYPHHVGQIVTLGKLLKGDEWNSLSIPKGGSDEYNAEKFSKQKGDSHFTDHV
ncbi:MAG: DUF1572 family protein [Cyclobacteriaceae bacterium]